MGACSKPLNRRPRYNGIFTQQPWGWLNNSFYVHGRECKICFIFLGKCGFNIYEDILSQHIWTCFHILHRFGKDVLRIFGKILGTSVITDDCLIILVKTAMNGGLLVTAATIFSTKPAFGGRTRKDQFWLVVWNIFYFPIYWEWSSQLTNILKTPTRIEMGYTCGFTPLKISWQMGLWHNFLLFSKEFLAALFVKVYGRQLWEICELPIYYIGKMAFLG